jgi:hypothetical protein
MGHAARRTVVALCGGILASVLAIGVSTAAHAAAPEILVSEDGVTFTPGLTVNLFDDIALIVPGDEIHSHLWVRNSSSTAALMRVSVDDLVVSSPAIGAATTLTTTASGFTYAATLSSLSNCQVVVQAITVQAGQTVRVDIDLLMSSAVTGNTAQGDTASLDLRVYAHEWAAGPFPPGDGCATLPDTGGSESGTSGGKLPWTGAQEVLPTIFVAVALIGLGALFAGLRRRRREGETRRS